MVHNSFKATTIIDILRYRSGATPEAIAYNFLVDGETETVSFTYQQLEAAATGIAQTLSTVCQPGDRVLLLYPPGLDYIAAFFGCLMAGMVAVPAYPPRPNRSLSRILVMAADCDAKVALTNQTVLAGVRRQLAATPELEHLQWLATDGLTGATGIWQPPEIDGETLAFLQYTSGSTGAPKGVKIVHSNLMHNLEVIYKCFGHHNESAGVIWLPPYHDMGLIGGVLQPLYGGFPVTLMSPLMFLQNPFRWLQAISRYRGTTSGGPNFAYEFCTRKIPEERLELLDLSSWDLAFNGAEPIHYDTLERFAAKFAPCGFRKEAFYPCYGMAEATLMVSGGVKGAPLVTKMVDGPALTENRVVVVGEEGEGRILVGCGVAVPGHGVAIVHPETGVRCADGEIGEIWAIGPSIARGYWQKPELSDETFGAVIKDDEAAPLSPETPSKYLRTGDLGFLVAGQLFVTGRLKDLIIVGGQNHYPQDIERTVEAAHPSIRPSSVAAFAVEVEEDEKLVVLAEVERRPRNLVSPNGSEVLNVKEVIQSIRRSVWEHHDLLVYSALLLKPGGIPKTSSGKIQRHACRAGFLAGTLEVLPD
ncbi:MAG: fatty acyl-AMP ligase [Oscillatoriaceae cyanobacterium]